MDFKRKKAIRNKSGFTLAEALLATALLSIATAGAVLPFTGGAAVQAEGIHRTIAAGLADDLVQKIMIQDFDNITTFYGSYSEAQGQIEDCSGFILTDSLYSRFSRTATCQKVHLSQQSGTSQENFILINVKVFHNGKELIELERLMAQ